MLLPSSAVNMEAPGFSEASVVFARLHAVMSVNTQVNNCVSFNSILKLETVC
jgi:hypothetical protein